MDIDTRDDSQELLYMMVKKWVTMRGFALASSWLQDHKKKASRKELCEKKTAPKHLNHNFSYYDEQLYYAT